ncbi:hypothetical protein NFJ02_27g64400 [Pycnococcus provasolii]
MAQCDDDEGTLVSSREPDDNNNNNNNNQETGNGNDNANKNASTSRNKNKRHKPNDFTSKQVPKPTATQKIRTPHSLLAARLDLPLALQPSPGGLAGTSNRVSVRGIHEQNIHFYVASSNKVYACTIKLKDDDRKTPAIAKENVVAYTKADAPVQVNDVSPAIPHRREIQNTLLWAPPNATNGDDTSWILAGDNAHLATTDAAGRCVVTRLRAADDLESPNAPASFYELAPREDWSTSYESGSAAAAIHPTFTAPGGYAPRVVAVMRSPRKCVDLYDGELHARTISLCAQPAAVSFVQGAGPGKANNGVAAKTNPLTPETGLLAVLEASQVSLWDVRASEAGGCVHRLDGASPGAKLTCLATAHGIVAAGGMDRCVTVWDARRWAPIGRWTGGLKHHLEHLHFAGGDETIDGIAPHAMYAAGAGFELTCATCRDDARALFQVRGLSRWLGVDVASSNGEDVVVGWCDCSEAIALRTKTHEET